MVERRADRPLLEQDGASDERAPAIPEHSAPPPAYGNKIVMAGLAEPAQKL